MNENEDLIETLANINQQDIENDKKDYVNMLEYGAHQIILIFVPVSACMLLVIINLKLIKSYQSGNGVYLIYTPFQENINQTSTKIWHSMANASIFLSVVIVITTVLTFLYKYNFYKVIQFWLAFSSFILLFIFTYMYVSEFVKAFNVIVDFPTVIILMWNFGCVGMICIHWIGPLYLHQAYMIILSSQMALILVKFLPDWTTWVLLVFISVWDLVAVLCPFGPLRILVETAKTRKNKLFPGITYSSTMMYKLTNMFSIDHQSLTVAHNNDADHGDTVVEDRMKLERMNDVIKRSCDKTNIKESDDINPKIDHSVDVPKLNGAECFEDSFDITDNEDEDGVKLGLGDFIFYSVLVGKASVLGDSNTVIACFFAILIRPLPALPISLTFGLIFYFCTNEVVRPFYNSLTRKQYFI